MGHPLVDVQGSSEKIYKKKPVPIGMGGFYRYMQKNAVKFWGTKAKLKGMEAIALMAFI